MPKGEHFKKENPRIHQVSFKVNKTELDLLHQKVKEAGVSIPEWIRQFITSDIAEVKASPKPKKVTAPRKPKVKKEEGPDDGVHRGEQTSLF